MTGTTWAHLPEVGAEGAHDGMRHHAWVLNSDMASRTCGQTSKIMRGGMC